MDIQPDASRRPLVMERWRQRHNLAEPQQMKVSDIMTRPPITVRSDVSIRSAARLLVEHRVSGAPVVNEANTLVGIISEGDLIMRQAPTERRPWRHFFFVSEEQLAREFQKRAGSTVGEVMTRQVISVSPDLDVATAAALLHHHRIRRLPVVAGSRVVGVVSRHDIVKAMAEGPNAPRARQPDAALVAAMRVDLEREPWVSSPHIGVEAKDGMLILQGRVASEAERAALETMARAIAGCQGVENRLSVLPSSPG